MESDIAWLQPEQEGPAGDLFGRIWRRQQELERLQLSSRLRSVPDLIDQHLPHDRSCTVDFNERRAELVGQHGGCPWLMPGRLYSAGVLGDIDIVVMGNWDKCLEMLKDALIRAEICDAGSIKVLDKAAVPIIKLTDRRTEVKVDISFNMTNGLVSANQIKQYMTEYPDMPKLVIALKQFLLQRELNEVFTGGISSYSLILMTVGFLQTYETDLDSFPGCKLGILLIEFFEMYGLKFNYLKTCIKVKDHGYAPRSQVEEQFAAHSVHNSPLCIEDPHNAGNDIGRSSYNMMKVKEAFKYAYQRLSSAVLSPGSACDPNRTSLLGRVIRVTDQVVEYRRGIRESFSTPHRAASYSPHSSSSPLSSCASDASVSGAGPPGRALGRRARAATDMED
ncbi:terminal nucleotidyltransferase 4B-like [Pollicipes pollicipes]|uniref:terminal nucleotidyltransferase 4B-like n=1 Tax=Pollicipes pollicipes TaxID=41117 RepID=UPI001884B4B5|nr:terminal nucleotidyltransferase 4B-like [Pollicipes pollicipes]